MRILLIFLASLNIQAASKSESAPSPDVAEIAHGDEPSTESILSDEFEIAQATQAAQAEEVSLESLAPSQVDIASSALKESEIPVLTETKKPKEAQTVQPVRKMAVSLGIIIAVIAGVAFMARRWLIQKKALAPNTQIRVISQHYLGPRKSLAIIHVAGESLLVGITDQNIGLIKQLSLIDDEIPANIPKRFDEELTFTENTQAEQGEAFSMRNLKEVVASRLKNMREI